MHFLISDCDAFFEISTHILNCNLRHFDSESSRIGNCNRYVDDVKHHRINQFSTKMCFLSNFNFLCVLGWAPISPKSR